MPYSLTTASAVSTPNAIDRGQIGTHPAKSNLPSFVLMPPLDRLHALTIRQRRGRRILASARCQLLHAPLDLFFVLSDPILVSIVHFQAVG